MVYQAKKKSEEEEQQPTPTPEEPVAEEAKDDKKKAKAKKEKKPKAEKTAEPVSAVAATQGSSDEVDKLVQQKLEAAMQEQADQIRKLRGQLARETTMRTNLQEKADEQAAQIQDMSEQLRDHEEGDNFRSSASERELQKQVKSLSEQLNTQLNVNKSLTSKLLIIEKSLTDEKRLRKEVERKLVSSKPPAGPMGSREDRHGEVLSQMEDQLAQVNRRVQNYLK